MARKVSVKTILNHDALDEIRRREADGMAEIGARVIEVSRPHVPDAPPIGKGLIETGDWGVWVDGRKVGGTATKPSREPVKEGITLFAGYGFPGRFLEEGTIYITPRPWVTPALLEVIPDKDGILAEKFK